MKKIPEEWDHDSEMLWEKGKRVEAIQCLLKSFNALSPEHRTELALQCSYYLFLMQDYASCALILEGQEASNPNDIRLLENLAVVYNRLGRWADAERVARQVLGREPHDIMAYDVLTRALGHEGHLEEVSRTGTAVLRLKDARVQPAARLAPHWALPPEGVQAFCARRSRPNVCAFTLWGHNPRYLRGALQNILVGRELFPDWTLRFYVDTTVPSAFLQLISTEGAQVVRMPDGQSLRQHLCWRFLVANDPAVGRFLVRDCDSVFSAREKLAVEEWVASDRWFHVIRDYCSHTDLILAGLWGGVAGVLPNLQELLANYAPNRMETPNIDQWFLGDRVWPFVRESCLMHDRLFHLRDSRPLPGKVPARPSHVGMNVHATAPLVQEAFLLSWIQRNPCLGPLHTSGSSEGK